MRVWRRLLAILRDQRGEFDMSLFDFGDVGFPSSDAISTAAVAPPPAYDFEKVFAGESGPVGGTLGEVSDVAHVAGKTPTPGGGWWQTFLDATKGAGSIAGLGAGVLGAVNANKTAKTLADQAALQKRAQDVQLAGATAAQAEAPKVAAYAPQVAAVAPAAADVASRLKTNVSGPETAFGTKQLELAASGNIPEAQQAQIDQWAQAQKAKLTDFFARAGLGESSQLQQALAEIDKQAVAMKMQGIQAEEDLGLKSLQQGGGALTQEVGADTAQADILATAGATEASAGALDASSAQVAGGAAQTAQAQEKALMDLIATSQAALARLNAAAA